MPLVRSKDVLRLLAAGAAGYALLLVVRAVGQMQRRQKLMADAQRKRKERDEKRQREYSHLRFSEVPHGMEIIRMTVQQLREALDSGRFSCEQVMTAFCARAKEAGEVLDLNAEELFLEAIEEAKKCDAELRQGKKRGPLHGIPLSVKDQIALKGFDSTMGLACRVFQPKDYTSILVQMLQEAGAVPFVRSNVMQCLLLNESANLIWGAACNPFDPNRTPGGSSGGEAGLIACGASPLGIGTDIAGSVRIPAAFCGLVGFKPTPMRMARHGVGAPRPKDQVGQNAVFSTAGFLGKSVADCELAMRVVCSQAPSGASMWRTDMVPELPWKVDAAADDRKMTFGVLYSDNFFEPAPSYRRALDLVKTELEAAGHKVVPIHFDLREQGALYVALMAAEGRMRGFHDGLEGEQLHPYYSVLKNIAQCPGWLRSLLIGATSALGLSRSAAVLRAGWPRNTYEYWGLIKQRDALRREFSQYLKAQGIDAVLCPGSGLPAILHGGSSKLAISASYNYLWSNFNYPAGTVPVTYVEPGEDDYPTKERDTFETAAKVNLKGSVGLPICVQVAMPTWKDESCISAMRHVEKAAAKTWKQPVLSKDSPTVRKP